MADGNLGNLWFDLNLRSNGTEKEIKKLQSKLEELDLATKKGREEAEKLFAAMNANSGKIAEDFKNVAAQMAIQAEETARTNARLKELAKLKEDMLRMDREAAEHGAFLAMQAKAAQDLAARYGELAKLKEEILRRDREMEAHGAFVALSAEAREAQALAERERELARLKAAIVRRNDEMAAAERRLAEAVAATNRARQEGIKTSRQSAENIVRERVALLEQQRQQLLKLFTTTRSNGRDELPDMKQNWEVWQAYNKVRKELAAIREVARDMERYSINGLFGAARGTSDFSTLISTYQKANAERRRSIELERQHQAEVAKTAARVRSDLVRAFEQAKDKAGGLGRTLEDLKGLFLQGGLVYGAQQFVMSVIQTGGELEKQHIAMQSILGDMQNANTMFAQVKQLALNSPFTFSELNKDVKQLAAYGVEYEDLYDTTKRLADMSSGLGVSFERIALAFGQVQARGWLDGKELRQIAYAGIPLLDKLSEYYSKREGRKVTTSEVKTRISGRGVDFEDVKNVFWEMTDAGGQFYNMQQVLSDTLLGKYNKLKDAWEIMLSEFASGNSVVGKGLKGILELVTGLVQALHSAAPVVAAAFSGAALRKLQTSLGGGVDKAILGAKGSIAGEVMQKTMRGETVTAEEKTLLRTKNQITAAELRTLAAAGALQRTELQRLFVAGKITKQMYLQGMALAQQEGQQKRAGLMGMLGGWAGKGSGAKWGALGSVIGGGLKSLGRSVLGFFGGLPGIAISAGAAIFAWYEQKNAELKQAMEQTANELKDRATQMSEFLRDNDTGKAISGGDEKEIDNMIEAYKEKIRQISPESAAAFVMKSEEIKSHKERLKYLERQLELLKEANETAQEKAADEGTFEDLRDDTDEAVKATDELLKASAAMRSVNLTGNEKGNFDDAKKEFDKYIEYVGEKLRNEFPDIQNSEKQQEAMRALRDNMLAAAGASEETAIQIRSALNRHLGLEDTEMEKAFSKKFMDMVDTAFPAIADRIRAHKELDAESRKKVENLMRGATAQLQLEYPMWAQELQNLLANSNFEAKINLVYKTDSLTPLTDFEQRIFGNVTDTADSSKWKARAGQWEALKPYLKGVNNMYDARNAVKTELTTRHNRWKAEEDAKKKGKGDETERKRLESSYKELWDAAYNGLGYEYVPEDKKSNKKPKTKTNTGDEALKNLQQRLDDFKAARQMYQKLVKEAGRGKEEARNEVKKLFPNMDWKALDLDDYTGSIDKLMPGAEFWNTPERKRFQTQANREKAEWNISEVLKPEFDRVAENFKESLEKGVRNADLEKELLAKTGDKGFAALAWRDGALWDGQTRGMAEQFRQMTGRDIDVDMTDADAKKMLENDRNAYVLWQKITTLVKDRYVQSLRDAADIMERTASAEEKLAAIDAKYAKKIKEAEARGDRPTATRYRQQAEKERGGVKLEKFRNSADYLNFYGAITQLGEQKAQGIATEIRKEINKALQDGAIDAREYAKEIKQLEEQLDKLGETRPSFLNGGLDGMVAAKKEKGNAMFTQGSSKYNDARKAYDEAQIKGDEKGMAAAKDEMAAGQAMMDGGSALLKGAGEMAGSIGMIDKIIHGINDTVQGLNDTFQDIRETAGALGADTESDKWTDANSFFSGFSSASASATKGWESLKSGNVGGVISGVVGSFTGWIKAFAAGHDAKLDRQIKLAERNITELERMSQNVKAVIEKTLGGVYRWEMDADTKKTLKEATQGRQYGEGTKNAAQSALANPTNSYKAELASMMAQRDELQRQRDAEGGKKKKNKDKIADYDQQLKEMDLTIKTLSQDFLKDMYSIDMKSWASQLTDAVVGAWEKGEDAMDAYRKKAKELVKDVTKSIVSQKFMETALEKPLAYLEDLINEKGKLDETDMGKLVDDLVAAGENATYNITAVMDALKAKGYDFSESGSGSVTNSIKNVTEETADVLASYLNAVRLDVSVNRAQIQSMGELLRAQVPVMSQIQKAQLAQLTQLVTLAEARNEKLDRMTDWMTAVTTGGRKKVYVG